MDVSLDDLITRSKKSTRGGRSGGPVRTRDRVAAAAAPSVPSRSRPYPPPLPFKPVQRSSNNAWQHDLFEDKEGYQPVKVNMAIETGTKLYVSNLDFGVSNEDIKELFSEVGDLKRCGVHYDRSGRSKGTAEVVFSRRTDALLAIKQYNNVQLDGKLMKIELVGTNLSAPAPPSVPIMPPLIGIVPPSKGRGVLSGRGGGGLSRRGEGRGQGRGGGRGSSKINAAELDADLDLYHAEAMQIS